MESWQAVLRCQLLVEGSECLNMVEFVSRLNMHFFFSSRRRHTRFKCDWSSDVCSSDLYEFCYFNTSEGDDPPVYQYIERSEEHTSELQSHLNLVCRLLIEKKKMKSKTMYSAASITTSRWHDI